MRLPELGTALRVAGALLLVTSTALPLGTCTQKLESGETVTSELRHTLDREVVSDPEQWPALVAYLWPFVVMPAFFVVRGPRARLGLRIAEVALLLFSAFALGTIFLIGRPAAGFYLGAALAAWAAVTRLRIAPERRLQAVVLATLALAMLISLALPVWARHVSLVRDETGRLRSHTHHIWDTGHIH